MWQRFTERARKVVFYSQEEALNFGEGYVSTEHLLLGLCREEDSVAALVLLKMDVEIKKIRAEVERQLPRGDPRPSQDMTLTPRAKRVIDLAYDEARKLNNNYIGTEHLLLGLIRESDGLAGRVLAKFGADLEVARKATAELQESNTSSSEPIGRTSPSRFGSGLALALTGQPGGLGFRSRSATTSTSYTPWTRCCSRFCPTLNLSSE